MTQIVNTVPHELKVIPAQKRGSPDSGGIREFVGQEKDKMCYKNKSSKARACERAFRIGEKEGRATMRGPLSNDERKDKDTRGN